MIINEYFSFPYPDFDNKGMNRQTGKCFTELIACWELTFHKQHPGFFANHLFGNPSTMIVLKSSMQHEENEDYGMEVFDGEIDMERHFLIDEHSKRKTIYALGSFLQENLDEPVFLIADDSLKDGRVILKYLPDDDEDDTEVPAGVPADRIQAG